MASSISAGNATNGLAISSDNTGILQLKSGTGAGTAAITVDASQNATFAGQIRSSTASTPPTFADSAGTTIGTLCRAWVNFDGTLTGTITPRAAFNISSVTYLGVGRYRIIMANALSDSNYAIIGSNNQNNTPAGTTDNGDMLSVTNVQTDNKTFDVTTWTNGGTAPTASYGVYVAVFR